ncbi:hypothetical protein LDENG_00279170 [Lucifuga dentata]|nr:hypothetical protein LDENG_00279170 [Lucifuga dentata]
MAERSPVKKSPSVVLKHKKRPSSSTMGSKVERSEVRPAGKPATAPAKQQTSDFCTKEEQYKLMNAELEAKTADLVRQAEQFMREQFEVKPMSSSSHLLTDSEDEEDSRIITPQKSSVQDRGVKVVNKKRVTGTSIPQHTRTGKQRKEHVSSKTAKSKVCLEELTAVEDSADFSLAKTVRSTEEKLKKAVADQNIVDDDDDVVDNIGSGILDAQTRVLKAKLRIMQEEMDQLSYECYRKDDEITRLGAKIKELEEDRARLQKTTNVQQTQIEKHKTLAEESAKKCDGLQLQVDGLKKEIESMNRSHKQAAGVHSTVEVRLNRAMEEVERLKTQLSKMKQMNTDKINEEHQTKENLLAENKMLKKQKAELIVGFKKQLKLIDILKRQKMHLEAAKLLSFTEEEFMKALDWGKS